MTYSNYRKTILRHQFSICFFFDNNCSTFLQKASQSIKHFIAYFFYTRNKIKYENGTIFNPSKFDLMLAAATYCDKKLMSTAYLRCHMSKLWWTAAKLMLYNFNVQTIQHLLPKLHYWNLHLDWKQWHFSCNYIVFHLFCCFFFW